MILRFFCSEG